MHNFSSRIKDKFPTKQKNNIYSTQSYDPTYHSSILNSRNTKQTNQQSKFSNQSKFIQSTHQQTLISATIIIFYPYQLPILTQSNYQQTLCISDKTYNIKQKIRNEIISTNQFLKFRNFQMKLWAINDITKEQFYERVRKVLTIQVKRKNYYIRINGNAIVDSQPINKYVKNSNFIIIAEILQRQQQLCIINQLEIITGKCANCGWIKQLKIICNKCKDQFYCSNDCQKSFQSFHKQLCYQQLNNNTPLTPQTNQQIPQTNKLTTQTNQLKTEKQQIILSNNQIQDYQNNKISFSSITTRTKRSEKDIKYSIRPIGLINLGNTCYMNASLQCLFHTVEFVQFFITNKQLENNKSRFVLQLYNLIKSITSSTHLKYIDPTQFKKQLGKQFPQFSGYSQQDSFSFILNLLDFILDYSNQVKVKTPFQKVFGKQTSDNSAFIKFQKGFQDNNKSYFVDIFYGCQKIRTFCHTCQKESKRFDIFTAVMLPLVSKQDKGPKRKGLSSFQQSEIISLIDCLKDYQQQLNIGNMLFCKNCGFDTKNDITKQFYKLPNILILNLKRFISNGSFYKKNNIKVSITQTIDINEPKSNRMIQYELYAVVNHVGDLSFGHYFAFCKDKQTNKWSEFNDEKVTQLSSISFNHAYILFYRRCK